VRREASVLLWGPNVITVVVSPQMADLVPVRISILRWLDDARVGPVSYQSRKYLRCGLCQTGAARRGERERRCLLAIRV